MNILHISAHLGGGIGKILSSLTSLDEKNQHKILTLEETKTTKFQEICIHQQVPLLTREDVDESLWQWADIVAVEWWNHPVTMEFLFQQLSAVSCRLLFYAHVSGCNFPYISPGFVEVPDKFVFSSLYSWHNPHWTQEERAHIQSKSSVILSSGVDQVEVLEKVAKNSFCVGYLGNLSYNKTFRDTVSYYEAVSKEISPLSFRIAGDVSYGKEFFDDLNQSFLRESVTFSGYVTDIREEFRHYDVLSYLLKPDNFATAENALLEGMAFGVPPVVFGQCSEQYVVTHGETGFVVKNKEEYVTCMALLWKDPALRLQLGKNASAFIKKEASVYSTVKKFQHCYEDMMKAPKKSHDFSSFFGKTPKEWFFACYQGDTNKLEGNSAGHNSGGFGQWQAYFKDLF